MRILFCGSGSFAVPSLKALLSSDHEIAGILTQPARRAGRGGKLRRTPVAEAATAAGLAPIECPDINADSMVADIRAKKADVMVVVDFGQLIRLPARESIRMGAFNLHASLLPQLRGAAPINWAIIRGHQRSGVTSFRLVDRMDAGDIYLQEPGEIRPGDTSDELRDRFAELGAKVVCRTLELLAAGNVQPLAQDEAKATRAPRLAKSDGLIDWAADAVTIRNLIHGTWPWPGGQAVLVRTGGKELSVVIARGAVEDAVAAAQPGRIDDDLFVGTGRGRLRILEIKPAGRRLMGWRDFVNGYRIAEGDSFTKPVIRTAK